MADDDPIVERVAKALYNEAVKQALQDASDFDFDMSDSIRVFRKLTNETDTGIAIISAAYIDECLIKLFALHIDNSSRTVFRSITNFNGPLGTFSSRIDMAFGFSLISKNSHQRLNCIRKIRNKFAHSPFGFSFGTETIKNLVEELDVNHKRFIDEIRKSKEIRAVTKAPSRMTMKEVYLVKTALTLAFVASEMIALPTAKIKAPRRFKWN